MLQGPGGMAVGMEADSAAGRCWRVQVIFPADSYKVIDCFIPNTQLDSASVTIPLNAFKALFVVRRSVVPM